MHRANRWIHQLVLPRVRKLSTKTSTSVITQFSRQFPITTEWVSNANEICLKSNNGNNNINNNGHKQRSQTNPIHQLVLDKCTTVVNILHDNVGLNNPTVLDFIKFIENPAKLDHFFRGSMVLLMCQLDPEKYPSNTNKQLQLYLASMSEFVNLAILLHHMIIDHRNDGEKNRHNKIISILGDYFLANIFFNLVQFKHIEIFSLFTALSATISEGFFCKTKHAKNGWLDFTFMNYSSVLAYGFQSAIVLNASKDIILQKQAFDLGKNVGNYLRAHQEVYDDTDEFADKNTKIDMMKIFRDNSLQLIEQLPLRLEAKNCFNLLFQYNVS
ncbi:Decaprenyl-diphosphate synthase subunit 2 [Blomia tropicalis]|nr:Decaprenyl-diphosphate synthase subunit 2 [Blomia tropicalis]